jgi:hypothetical protein
VRDLVFLVIALTGCGLIPHPIDRADPRFLDCGGDANNSVAAFAFVAEEYRDHFPEMGNAPEVEAELDAFAVVFDLGYRPATIMGGAPLVDPPPPTGHFVCVYLGKPGQGETTLYADVDIAWMEP